LAFVLAVMSAAVAVAALIFIATPSFTDATGSYARIALTGVVPALAILAVGCAARASSRVLKVRWSAVVLGVLGSVATSLTYEQWYSGVEGTQPSNALIIIAACASIALNGSALVVLMAPGLRSLPAGAAIALGALILVFGGAVALAFVFPMLSTLLVALGAVITVIVMRRAEGRPALATTV
jgi:hypothetical protein